MRKALVISNLGRHFRKFGHYDYKVLLELGFEVHIAANFKEEIDNFTDSNVIKHQIDFNRNPFSLSNFRAYKQLRLLLLNNNFLIVQTQSPSGGFVTRLSAIKARKKGTKVIYTAHGFHFYKGASIINWLLFFSIEKILGYITDILITINNDDFQIANKRKIVNDVRFIPGVGIDLDKFYPISHNEKINLRTKYGFIDSDFIIISIGELNRNKHQDILIDVVNILRKDIPNVKLLLVGNGVYFNKYQHKATKLNLMNKVFFLGHRSDVHALLSISDIAVSSSRREGLPVNVMEAMACGLPLVVTNCRGNTDLVKHNINGFVVGINDDYGFASSIKKIYYDNELKEKFGKESFCIIKEYDKKVVNHKMKLIYNSVVK